MRPRKSRKEEGILPNEAHFGLRKSFANRVSVAVLGGPGEQRRHEACTLMRSTLAWVPCRLKLFPCFFLPFSLNILNLQPPGVAMPIVVRKNALTPGRGRSVHAISWPHLRRADRHCTTLQLRSSGTPLDGFADERLHIIELS